METNNLYIIVYYFIDDETKTIKYIPKRIFAREQDARKEFMSLIRLSDYGWYRLYKMNEI